MFGKEVVLDVKSQRAQILYGENGSGAGVSFSKGMYLPEAGNKSRVFSDSVENSLCIRLSGKEQQNRQEQGQ